MSLEFNNPLYIGDKDAAVKSDIAELQSDIGDLSQLETGDKSSLVNALNEAMDSTLNGVNRDLTNLSDDGINELHTLTRPITAYANEGELLTDAEGLADVKNYAHSTFDASKFTVVGSPNITNDGIASGFSNSNYIKRNNVFNNFSTFELTVKKNNGTGVLWAGRHIPDSSYTDQNVCILNQLSSTTLRLLWRNGNGGSVIDKTWTVNASTEVYKILISNNNVYLYEDDVVNGSPTSLITANLYKGFEELFIGIVGSIGDAYTGTIDLKQFSIAVDGVEIFSGNKTGIDTVKSDDYTVVGTPTISDDGVASGFSADDYITFTDKIASLTSQFKVVGEFMIPTSISGSQAIYGVANTDANNWIHTYLNSSGDFKFTIGVAGTQTNCTISHSNITLGETYEFETSQSANGTMTAKTRLKGNDNWVTVTNASALINLATVTSARIGQSPLVTTEAFGGKINFNALKIYVNGNLVYQPCLKIPYTESKTGSKIVNSIYRDRVNDMANQFGYANYYTLSDTDFTLPQVELYGLIGQRTLRDSYRNGINYWELYSNRDLEQGGSCTSGVEVTFARPFADTNYVLSVPYSAKSATAFTPTQTGDWIAKGKGIL